MTARRVLGVAVALGLLLVLSGCTLTNVTARQEQATGLWEELVGGASFGQTFLSTRNNLYRIELGTATFARINTAPVVFHLRASPQDDVDILTVTVPGPEIQNERPTVVEFSPLLDSQGQTYYFFLESPAATPGNAITTYASNLDAYVEGTAFRNGQPVAGDLVFSAYSREAYCLPVVLSDCVSRARQDGAFCVCYGILVLAIGIGLVALIRRRT